MRAWCWRFYRFPGFSPLSLCLVCSLRTMFSDSAASDRIKMRRGDVLITGMNEEHSYQLGIVARKSAENLRSFEGVGISRARRQSRAGCQSKSKSTDATKPSPRPLNRISQVHCRISHVHNNTLPWTSSFSHSCVEIMQSSIPRISRERRKFSRSSLQSQPSLSHAVRRRSALRRAFSALRLSVARLRAFLRERD